MVQSNILDPTAGLQQCLQVGFTTGVCGAKDGQSDHLFLK
jgi:hypothetical protein